MNKDTSKPKTKRRPHPLNIAALLLIIIVGAIFIAWLYK